MADGPRELKKTVLGDCSEYDDESTEEYWKSCAMQLASSSVVPMVMQAVVGLGVLEIISKAGGVSADEIASQLRLINGVTTTTASTMLDRMLCLLAAHSILTCTSTTTNVDQMTTNRRLYSLSPVAKYFIPDSSGVSLGPLLSIFNDKIFMDAWPELKATVLEGGILFNRFYGMNPFDYFGTDPRFSESFHKAMINQTTIAITEILKYYKGFDQVYRVVDVGGGLGATLKLITSKYPHIKGINLDLPHVIQHAPYYPGVEHVAGDMFENVPEGDAIFMKWILHDWSDELCLKLLKNCYEALPDEGKLIVVEGILPMVPDTSPAAKSVFQCDIMMMAMTPGGKERTRQMFLSLATTAGFAGIRFECCAYTVWVMEFYK